MKVSASVRPEHIIAAAYVVAHLPSLSPTLEDIDSLNFALGLRELALGLSQHHVGSGLQAQPLHRALQHGAVQPKQTLPQHG